MSTMTPQPHGQNDGFSSYITEITLPSGNKYEIVDQAVREYVTSLDTNINSVSANVNSISSAVSSVSANVNSISATLGGLQDVVSNLSSYTKFLGVINTNVAASILSDGASITMVAVNGANTASTTATTGAIVLQPTTTGESSDEFIFDGAKWQLIGNISVDNLGPLASVSAVSTTYTPAGSVTVDSNINISTTGSIKIQGNINSLNVAGSYTPAGDVSFTSFDTPVIISGITTTASENSATYIAYQPQGTLQNLTASITTSSVVNEIVTAASTASSGVSVASVSGNTLRLYFLEANTAAVMTGITSVTGEFSGTEIYMQKETINIPSAASFTGTSGTVSASASSISVPITANNSADAITFSTTGTISTAAISMTFTGTAEQIVSTAYSSGS